jgi:hypothetical protein
MTRSSAKKMAEMLMVSRSIPKPDKFSSAPRSLMKSEKSNGDKLHPGKKRKTKLILNMKF